MILYKIIIKFTTYFFIPLVLLILSLILTLSYLFNSDLSPSIVSYKHSSDSIYKKGNIIKGSIKSQHDYISIITVSFEKSDRYVEGKSTFKIKQKGDKKWYHISEIDASQYYYYPIYSFGFPTIQKSKNKMYEFQIIFSNNSSQLQLSSGQPVLISKYQYPKNLIIGDTEVFIDFLSSKVKYYFSTDNWLSILLVTSSPLFIYLIHLLLRINSKYSEISNYYLRYCKKFIKSIPLLIFFGLIIDLFFIRQFNIFIFNNILFVWVLTIIAYNYKPIDSFVIAIICTIIFFLLLIPGMTWITDKSAIWSFSFFSIGVFHLVISDTEFNTKSPLFIPIYHVFSIIKTIAQYIDYLFSRIYYIFISFRIHIIQSFPKKPITLKDLANYISTAVYHLIKIMIIFSIIFALLIIVARTIQSEQKKAYRLSLNPRIDKIEPKIVYRSNKIIVFGNNFGWKDKKGYKLMTSQGLISTDLWTDSKIIFTVPLHWKDGDITLWVNKPIYFEDINSTAKSQKVYIKMISTLGNWDADDDAYFEQLKNLDIETLQLNGYYNVK